MITIITEPANNPSNQEKLVEIFKNLKSQNKNLEINLRIAKRSDAMRGYQPKNEEVLIIFGSRLYQHVLRDINEFDKIAGNPMREVHKFSYFVRRGDKHYFIAFMPPIDFAMSKPDTFLAFESFMKSLITTTQNFNLSLKESYLSKSLETRQNWPIDVVENGFSPKIKMHMRYDEAKSYLYSLFDLPDWHYIAIDYETTSLRFWDKDFHEIKVFSASTEDNLGHGINLSLPGLVGCYQNGQTKEIVELLGKYLFEKPKTFIAWNIGFEVFSTCTFYGKTYRDFLRCNRLLDGMHLLHILCENRKVEGYNLKAASRDLLNFAQYAFVQKYLDYIQNWKSYTPEQIIEAATGSLKYAAEDAAGEYSLTTRLKREIEDNPISKQHLIRIAPKVMAVKLETEWNGLTVDCDGMAKGSIACSGWELDNIVKPTLKKCEESSDKRLHADMFIFSTVTGRMLYGKPYLNGMKIGTKASQYFLADPGHKLLYIDLNSADLRCAALLSQDENLINDLNEEGDYYERFAKQLFAGLGIGEKERNIAKAFVLAMLNLSGNETIAKETGVSVADVKAYKSIFYDRYAGMKDYRYKLENFLKMNHMIFSASWRMRRFSDDDMTEGKDGNFFKSFLSAHNFPFQSTTADFMVVNCFDFIGETRDLGVKQCMLNIDAAVFNVPTENLETVKEKLKMFELVHFDLVNGAKHFNRLVLQKDGEIKMKLPKFTYKAFVGNNLNEMERL
jgi:hypothetical protein